MKDYIQLAADLVRSAPSDCGDPLPAWKELDEIGDKMREAAVMIRRQGDELSSLRKIVTDPTHPMQGIHIDTDGVIRFRQNKIVRFLIDLATNRGIGMNELAMMEFSDEDRSQFAQLIGYSVSGYGELGYAQGVKEADKIAAELKGEKS